MRYLQMSDFTRYANKPDIMSSIAEFKIPKGMVYAFSARMNMSLYIQEYQVQDGEAGTTTITLASAPIQCADLGADAVDCASMKDQIVVYVDGEPLTTIADWTLAWATGVMTPADGKFAAGTLNVQTIFCSCLDTDPAKARATTADYMGSLEIRAEAPAGQNIGIPIFSGSLGEIMGNVQNYGLTPLKLHGAVLLPEGFVLAVKILAPADAMAGTETRHTDGGKFADHANCAERIRIPYDRFNLRDFPRDLKARILHSMAVS